MIAVSVWKRLPKAVFWVVLAIFAWLVFFTALQFALSILQVNKPISSARPYFKKVKSRLSPTLTKDRTKALYTELQISIRNNDRPARNFISQLVVLDGQLNPNSGPLMRRRLEFVNDIGEHQFLNRKTRVAFHLKNRKTFVMYEIRYVDVFTDKVYPQIWFVKFTGLLPDRRSVVELVGISKDEKTKIEAYIRDREVPMLSAGFDEILKP